MKVRSDNGLGLVDVGHGAVGRQKEPSSRPEKSPNNDDRLTRHSIRTEGMERGKGKSGQPTLPVVELSATSGAMRD
jgi:hypothetical protein